MATQIQAAEINVIEIDLHSTTETPTRVTSVFGVLSVSTPHTSLKTPTLGRRSAGNPHSIRSARRIVQDMKSCPRKDDY